MTTYITSQHFLDDDTIAEKIAAEDFEVQVSPEFEIDGEVYAVILDGTHSFYAAKKAGVNPVFIDQNATDNDNVSYLNRGDIDGFLEVAHMGEGDYIIAETRKYVW